MAREVEVADDLGTEQRHDVREDRVLEAGEDLFGDGRTADEMAPFEHDHCLPRAREVRRVHEAVVPPTNDDGVIAMDRHDRFRSGLKNGSALTVAMARLRRCSTVISISSGVPGFA